MNQERFRFIRIVHHESDLMIGISHQAEYSGIEHLVNDELTRLRDILQDYSRKDPRFFSSLDPLEAVDTSEELQTMMSCGKRTGTGPMSSVAGLFAEAVGRRIVDFYGEMEVVVENGGDLYLRNDSELLSVIHAGSSSLSNMMALVVPPGEWGICTSSGTIGHSFSRGKADAVSVVCASAPLADSWATAIANRVQNAKDMEQELDTVSAIPEILGCAIIVDEKIGLRGQFELKLLSREK